MSEIIKEAKTVEAAIADALKDLQCSEDDVVIDVLQQPSKGIFGISKMAKVRVKYINANVKDGYERTIGENRTTKKESGSLEKDGKRSIQKLLSLMGFQTATVKSRRDEENIYLDVHSDSEGLLIGKHGQTIGAIQYLINRMNKDEHSKDVHFVVDVGSYRNRHKNILEKTAKKVAERVKESGKEEALQAMSAFDRRIVHMALKDNQDIVTYSQGENQDRHIVVAPKERTSL